MAAMQTRLCTLPSRPDEKRSPNVNCLKPNFAYGGSGQAGWKGAGLTVGAGVLLTAGVYKMMDKQPQKSAESVERVAADASNLEKIGLHQSIMDSKTPAGVLTRIDVTAAESERGSESGAPGEANKEGPGEGDAAQLPAQAAADDDEKAASEECTPEASNDTNDSDGVVTSCQMNQMKVFGLLPSNNFKSWTRSPQHQPELQFKADHMWLRLLLYILLSCGYIRILPRRFAATHSWSDAQRSWQDGVSHTYKSTQRQRPPRDSYGFLADDTVLRPYKELQIDSLVLKSCTSRAVKESLSGFGAMPAFLLGESLREDQKRTQFEASRQSPTANVGALLRLLCSDVPNAIHRNMVFLLREKDQRLLCSIQSESDVRKESGGRE
ncbi:hypothetical protein Bbelb_383800 [Branchiostoma belcheri]|nr:hypothetical protein Bbelb_383800 [Branchiostoma belcheri]